MKREPSMQTQDTQAQIPGLAPAASGGTVAALPPQGPARVLMPNRSQMEMRPSDLESLLALGHRARLVWGYVERQDLSKLYAGIKSRQGGAGRSAIAPEILFALWLYATLDNVGSAREIERLTQAHDAYRWICGGVQVNYHSLADFRVDHGAVLDDLLADNIAALMAAGAVKLKSVAQDGVRVRASAGAASFRREERLTTQLAQAREQVQSLKHEIENDPGSHSRQQAAARERAAREREARIQAALNRLPEVQAIKRRQGKKSEDARSSTTDADATVMKMGDGGFRPAYNAQFASDCESQVVVGVDVITIGSDMNALAPMVTQVGRRCGQSPGQWLVDGGYPKHEQIDAVADHTTVYAPVPQAKRTDKDKDAGKDAGKDEGDKEAAPADTPVSNADANADKHTPKAGDSAAVASWRERMSSDAAKEIYKQRAATAECVNAQARNRGLVLLKVRGLAKVKCVATWFALAHNVLRTITLAPHLVGIGTGTSAVAATG